MSDINFNPVTGSGFVQSNQTDAIFDINVDNYAALSASIFPRQTNHFDLGRQDLQWHDIWGDLKGTADSSSYTSGSVYFSPYVVYGLTASVAARSILADTASFSIVTQLTQSSASSSLSDTASYVKGNVEFDPSTIYNLTSSNAVSSSYISASVTFDTGIVYPLTSSNSVTASYATGSVTFDTTIVYLLTASNAVTASYALNGGGSVSLSGVDNYFPKYQSNTLTTSSLLNERNGNIGIDRIFPLFKFHLYGGTLPSIVNSTLTSSVFEMMNNNSSAIRFLDRRFVSGSDWQSAATRIVKTTDLTDQAYIEFNPSGSQYGLAFGTNDNSGNPNFEVMRFNRLGNVSIGNTNAGAKLHVQGDISASNFLGTASLASNAVSSSYAVTASYAPLEPAASSSLLLQLAGKQATLITGNTYSITSSWAVNSLTSTPWTGSGTTNYFPKWISNTLTTSSNLYDDGIRVGIGLIPSFRLHVYGGILSTIAGSTMTSSAFQINNGNASMIRFIDRRFLTGSDWQTTSTRIVKTIDNTDQGYIEFNPSGSQYGVSIGTNDQAGNSNYEIMRFLNNGRVGILTSNPGATLHVQGNISCSNLLGTSSYALTTGNVLSSSYAATASVAIIAIQANSATSANTATNVTNPNPGTGTNFYVPRWNNSNQLTPTSSIYIDPKENVGISTTSPLAKLHIFAGTLPQASSSIITSSIFGVTAGTNGSTLRFIDRRFLTGVSWTSTSTRIVKNIDGTDQGYLEFNPSGSQGGLAIGTGTNEMVRITETGKIGVGITSPIYQLEMGNISTPLISRFISNDTNFGLISDWQTNADKDVNLRFVKSDFDGWTYGMDSSNNYAWTIARSISSLNIIPSSNKYFAVTLAGDIGMGTITPGAKLHVQGNISCSNLLGTSSYALHALSASYANNAGTALTANFASNAGTATNVTNPNPGTGTNNYLPKWNSNQLTGTSNLYDNGTNVGVSTTSPSSKLTVNGSTYLDGDLRLGFPIETHASGAMQIVKWGKVTVDGISGDSYVPIYQLI